MKRTKPFKNPFQLFFAGLVLGMTSLGLMAGEEATSDAQDIELIYASDLTGAEVLDAHNVSIGSIADFVVTFGKTGRVTHIVVTDALLPLLDENKRLIPAEAVERVGGKYRLTVPKQIVALSAELGRNQVEWIQNPEALARLDKVYEVVPDDNERAHYLYSSVGEMRAELENGRDIGYVHDILLTLQDNWTPFVILLVTDEILRQSPRDRLGIPTPDISVESGSGPASLRIHLPFSTLQDASLVKSEADLSRELTRRGRIIILRD